MSKRNVPLIVSLVLVCTTTFGEVDRVTYYQDVQPILAENCVDCHRPAGNNIMGMVAPMPLRTFKEVRPWAKSIAKQVEARSMPPWHASEEFHGVFANERTLTDDEISTVTRWVSTGAARGSGRDMEVTDTSDGSGWAIGEPDLVVSFDKPYFVQDWVEDHYQTIAVAIPKDKLPKDRWIKAMQFRPGSEAVHHIVIFTDGWRESIGFGQGMLGGMGPGTDSTQFPEGYGRLLEADSRVLFNMHYHKEPGPGTGVWDDSEIGFVFQDKPVQHDVSWGAIGTMYFSIPPHATNHEVVAEERFNTDTTLLALFPHTHLRGKASKYTAYYPDGSNEVLLHVPNYDFNWQTNYIYKEPKKIPAGTSIKVQMWYDNSEERAAYTGIDPSRSVRFGEPTTDEMMFGWIDYTDTKPMATTD